MDKNREFLIPDLCQKGTYSIHNMRAVNTDALSHHNKSPEKCIKTSEKLNKTNYME